MSTLSSADTETTETTEEEVVETDEVREALVADLTESLGEALVASHIDPGVDLWVRVTDEAWADLADVLRNRLGFDYFTFLSAMDWMPSPFGRNLDSEVDNILQGVEPPEPEPMEQGVTGGETRFQMLARVYSIRRNLGITLKADLASETEPTIDTWTRTYAGANWHEREAHEMFGITFRGHPNLIKLYLPADFEGYPLRKDFPLISRHVKPWPGIVDVEPMPGEDEPADEPPAEGEEG